MPHVGNRASDVSYFLTKQLDNLQLNYVDLYLIHMPMAFVAGPDGTPAKKEDGSFVLDDTDHVATWKVSLFNIILPIYAQQLKERKNKKNSIILKLK